MATVLFCGTGTTQIHQLALVGLPVPSIALEFLKEEGQIPSRLFTEQKAEETCLCT